MVKIHLKETIIRRVILSLFIALSFVLVLILYTRNQRFDQNGVKDEDDITKLEKAFAKEASKHLFLDNNFRVAIDTSDDVFENQHVTISNKPQIDQRDSFDSTDVEEAGYNSRYNENEREEKIDWNLDFSKNDASRYQCDLSRPVNNIVLLKTHRTGTGTLANIFYRYGDLNNYLFALPSRKTFDHFWPVKFHPSFLDQRILNFTRPNLLVNAQFNYATIKNLMPKETQVIAILRNPIEQLESAFVAMEMDLLLGLENVSDPFQEFLSSPRHHVMDYITRQKKFHFDLNFIKNGMFFDLGLQHKDYNNSVEIQLKIKELTGKLDLVLLTDYFDESLVLMKNEFCWDLDDIIYFKFNQRPRDLERKDFSEDLKRQILEWNKADSELYKHFNKTFWERVSEWGSEFYKEVKMLRVKVREMEEECLDHEKMKQLEETEEFTYDKIEVVLRKNITRKNQYLCEKMVKSEQDYVSYLKEKTSLLLQRSDAELVKQFQALSISSTFQGNLSLNGTGNESFGETPVVWVKR